MPSNEIIPPYTPEADGSAPQNVLVTVPSSTMQKCHDCFLRVTSGPNTDFNCIGLEVARVVDKTNQNLLKLYGFGETGRASLTWMLARAAVDGLLADRFQDDDGPVKTLADGMNSCPGPIIGPRRSPEQHASSARKETAELSAVSPIFSADHPATNSVSFRCREEDELIEPAGLSDIGIDTAREKNPFSRSVQVVYRRDQAMQRYHDAAQNVYTALTRLRSV